MCRRDSSGPQGGRGDSQTREHVLGSYVTRMKNTRLEGPHEQGRPFGADYVRTARAKGLIKSKAVTRHALRTSLVPMPTFFAFAVATRVVRSVMLSAKNLE